jgi:RNA polymerase sigma-70 factor (ECF subfamily)
METDLPIYSRVRQMTRACGVARDSVADVEQEVWLAFTEHLSHGSRTNEPAELAAWLSNVARNKAVDAIRRAAAHRAENLDTVKAAGQELVDPRPGPALQLERREAREALQAALEEVRRQPDGETNVRIIEWRVLDGRSAAEVGRTLGLSPKAVRLRQCRTLRRLRSMPNVVKLKDLWLEMGGVVSPSAATVA